MIKSLLYMNIKSSPKTYISDKSGELQSSDFLNHNISVSSLVIITKYMYFYLPANLNLSEKLKSIDKKEVKFLEQYYYFITRISSNKIYNKKNKDDYVHLKFDYLRNIINDRRIIKVRDNLIKMNILEVNHSYQVGNYSKSFKLTDEYANTRSFSKHLISSNLTNKIHKNSFSDFSNNIDKTINLEDVLNNNNISMLTTTYDSYFFSKYKSLIEDITIEEKQVKDYLETLNLDNKQYYNYSEAIERFIDKDFYIKIDIRSGRVYTNITNFPSVLRKFLKYKNNELIEIDIANSQPLLFSLLLDDSKKDVRLFKGLCESGIFYDYFLEKYNKKFEVNKDRSEFKKMFFHKVIFCKKYMNEVYPESKFFKTIFPNVWKSIYSMKVEDYKNLPRQLQKKEADIIIYTVAKELLENNIPVFTIHDSILTIKENVSSVKTKLLKVFESDYNIIPTLTIKGDYLCH